MGYLEIDSQLVMDQFTIMSTLITAVTVEMPDLDFDSFRPTEF